MMPIAAALKPTPLSGWTGPNLGLMGGKKNVKAREQSVFSLQVTILLINDTKQNCGELKHCTKCL